VFDGGDRVRGPILDLKLFVRDPPGGTRILVIARDPGAAIDHLRGVASLGTHTWLTRHPIYPKGLMSNKFCINHNCHRTDKVTVGLWWPMPRSAATRRPVFLSTDGVWLRSKARLEDQRREPFALPKDLIDKFVKAGGRIWFTAVHGCAASRLNN
jgi:hypothetical protein